MPDDDDHHHGQNQSSDLQLARSRRTEKVYKNSNVEGPDKRLMMSRRRRLGGGRGGEGSLNHCTLLDPFRMNRSSVEFHWFRKTFSVSSSRDSRPHTSADIGVPEERKKAFKKGRTCRTHTGNLDSGNQVETQLSYYFIFLLP